MWKFIEIDNFFDKKDLSFLMNQFSKIDLNHIKDNDIKVFSNKIFSDGRLITTLINPEKLLTLHNKYTPTLVDFLKKYLKK